MPCFHPLSGFRSAEVNPSGKRGVVFDRRKAFGHGVLTVELACGQCIGCRLERSRQWAVRCVHEASLYESNCFITLTYAPCHLPLGGSLVLSDFQLFMKRLRRRFPLSRIRFFHCGEYGERFARPHYHAILFNFDFPDRVFWRNSGDERLFTSEILSDLWGKGHCSVGSVTFDSAAYVARYCLKKITGNRAEAHYAGRLPEYTTMSRRPGIGRGWFEKFRSDCYPSDTVVLRGKEMRVPRAYDRVFELDFPSEFADVRRARLVLGRAVRGSPDSSFERLQVRERCQEITVQDSLKRKFEYGED